MLNWKRNHVIDLNPAVRWRFDSLFRLSARLVAACGVTFGPAIVESRFLPAV